MNTTSNTAVLRPEWADAPVRIDPTALDRRQTVERVEDGDPILYRIDRRGVTIRRTLERSGVPVTLALAPRAFRGIAARAMEDGAGNVTVTLELHHDDPKLTVPLLVAEDLYDVAADWRQWSELYGLPMLMVETDGTVVALEDTIGQVRNGEPAPRRRSGHHERRPRFLARRKPGGLGLRMTVSGTEIIART